MNNVCNFKTIERNLKISNEIQGLNQAPRQQRTDIIIIIIVFVINVAIIIDNVLFKHTTSIYISYNITPKKTKTTFWRIQNQFVCWFCASCFLKNENKKKEFLYSACFVRSKIPQRPQLLILSLCLSTFYSLTFEFLVRRRIVELYKN